MLFRSGDGRSVVAISNEQTTRVWNLAGGTSRELRSHNEPVRALAFSRDGKWVATGSNDRTIHIWDLQQGGFAVLRGHRAAILSLQFSDDGKTLVSASEDGCMRRWEMGRVQFAPHDREALATWIGLQTTARLPPVETARQRSKDNGESE